MCGMQIIRFFCLAMIDRCTTTKNQIMRWYFRDLFTMMKNFQYRFIGNMANIGTE